MSHREDSHMNIGDIAGNILSNLASAGIVALIAYIFRSNIRNFFVEPALKSKVHSPSLSLEIDAVKNTRNQWVTIFLLENTGDVDVSDLRVFLCSYGLASGSLLIEPIKIEDQRKWINDAGQRIQINTLSLHEGCNLTEDQRFFVEFTDGNGGTIYRMSRGLQVREMVNWRFMALASVGKDFHGRDYRREEM